jgi:hypothetical protein
MVGSFTLCQLIKRILKNPTTRERVTSNWYRSLLLFFFSLVRRELMERPSHFCVNNVLNRQVCQRTHFSQYNLSMIWTLDLASTKSQVTVYAKSSSLLLVRFYSSFPMLYPWKDRLSIGRWLISPSPAVTDSQGHLTRPLKQKIVSGKASIANPHYIKDNVSSISNH